MFVQNQDTKLERIIPDEEPVGKDTSWLKTVPKLLVFIRIQGGSYMRHIFCSRLPHLVNTKYDMKELCSTFEFLWIELMLAFCVSCLFIYSNPISVHNLLLVCSLVISVNPCCVDSVQPCRLFCGQYSSFIPQHLGRKKST